MTLLITMSLLVLLPGIFLFLGGGRRLPILMYHKVRPAQADSLTVPLEVFRNHLEVLARRGYQAICFADLLAHEEHGRPLPSKPVLLTFDDAYADFIEHPMTIMKDLGFSATVFLPVGHVGGENAWDGGGEAIMNWNDVRSVSDEGIEIGLHSWNHDNYRDLDPSDIEADLLRCLDTLGSESVPFVPVLAYPYGGLPRNGERRAHLESILEKVGIRYALRIGSRVHRLPTRSRFALRRVPMEGTDTGLRLWCKLALGRTRL